MAISGAFRLFLKGYVAVAAIVLLAVGLWRFESQFHWFRFRLEPDVLPAGYEQAMYVKDICAVTTNRSVSFDIKQGVLPNGLRLNHVSGRACARLEGMPTRPGRYFFTVRARQSGAPFFGRQASLDYILQIGRVKTDFYQGPPLITPATK